MTCMPLVTFGAEIASAYDRKIAGLSEIIHVSHPRLENLVSVMSAYHLLQ